LPKHLGLSLESFVVAVSPDLVEAVLTKAPDGQKAPPWANVNPVALKDYLGDLANAEAATLILDDFRKANDLAIATPASVSLAYERFAIPIRATDLTPHSLALRLLLEHPRAFEFAWSRYLLYATGAKLSTFFIPPSTVVLNDQTMAAFQAALSSWLARRSKGQQCRVELLDDEHQSVILVQRGQYMRPFPYWRDDDIEIGTFRPAVEDVLVYEPETSLLRMRITQHSDRTDYLLMFAVHCCGDLRVFEQARQTEVFSLTPVQDGTFNYGGAGMIAGVDLVKAKLKLPGARNTVLEIRSADVLESFRRDVRGITLQSGLLTSARFRFHIWRREGRARTVTFDIDPPDRTDLTEHEDARTILDYLAMQGVKLL
jgi:hypothetical protein